MKVRLSQTATAVVEGWADRHKNCRKISRIVAEAKKRDDFLVVYRGDRQPPPYFDSIFSTGISSRPQYHDGDTSKLRFNTREVVLEKELFDEVVDTHLETPLGKEATVEKSTILTQFERSDIKEKYELIEALLDALHYQNSRPAVEKFRDYLFPISASRKPAKAMKYGIAHYAGEAPPQTTYVYEYCPPNSSALVSSVKNIRKKYASLGLESDASKT